MFPTEGYISSNYSAQNIGHFKIEHINMPQHISFTFMEMKHDESSQQGSFSLEQDGNKMHLYISIKQQSLPSKQTYNRIT